MKFNLPKNCITIVISFFIVINLGKAQEKEKNWDIRFSGFVNAQIFYDTRQYIEAREGMVALYPKKKELDAEGNDINAKGSFNQLAMTSRLTGKVQGPDAFGANTSALIEGDFTGPTNSTNNVFRLREAWIKLKWKSREVMFGQYWHPLYSPEVRPNTISLNTGAPFHAFSRHNQIRFTQHIHALDIIGVAASQRDYSSDGPAGRSSAYMRNAVLPDLHLQFQYHLKDHIIGGGIGSKVIKPRDLIEENTGDKYQTDEKLYSYSALLFAKIDKLHWELKLQGVWGQNLTEHIMLGGYIESEIDTMDHQIAYSNTSQFSCWADLSSKGSTFRAAVFAGYAKNLGYDDPAVGKFYGSGYDIDYCYRISPRIMYFSGKIMAAAEFEYTVAAYGSPDNKGEFSTSEEVGNFRTLLGIFYFF